MDKKGDREFLKNIPEDFPLTIDPYDELAKKCAMNTDDLIERLDALKKAGTIRRIAAVLYHRNVSYTYNAMVVWRVEEDEVDEIGKKMALFPEVSHCYERDTGGYWKYNLYTMIHGKSKKECFDIVGRLSQHTGIKDFKVFFSKREFKKTSIRVINE
ncbi:MAG TPA: hypothetical protein PLW88_00835 [Syntrophorhabdaceae bacterium]|nr:hypothetical protein [Syntrophorhabdaceae bacterium]